MTANEKDHARNRQESGSGRFRRWCRRHPLAAVVGLLAIGAAAYHLTSQPGIEPPTEAELSYWAARRFVSEGQYLEALQRLDEALSAQPSRPEAVLLAARLRLNAGGDALERTRAQLRKHLDEERDESQGAIHQLLARSYRDSDPRSATRHEAAARRLAPQTAVACYYRSVATPLAEEAAAWLEKGLALDAIHVPTLKARALYFYAARQFTAMAALLRRAADLAPSDPSTLSLLALALREEGELDAALQIHATVLRLRPRDPEAHRERSRTHLLGGSYVRAAGDARDALALAPRAMQRFYRAHLLRTLIAAGDFEIIQKEFVGAPEDSRLDDWFLEGLAERAAFEELAAGRALSIPENLAASSPYRAMLDTATLVEWLGKKRASRIASPGFGASFSPDGERVVYARGVPGASVIEIVDLESGKTEVPAMDGRDPAWSPDGNLIAFVRHGEAVEWTELTLVRGRSPGIRRGEAVWLMTPGGRDLRRLTAGGAPAWSADSKRVYFHRGKRLGSIAVDPQSPAETAHLEITSPQPPAISRDERFVATHVLGKDLNELHAISLESGLPALRWFAPKWDAKGLRATWSPNGQELAVSGPPSDDMGLWIFNMESRKISQVFARGSMAAAWSPDGTRLVIELRAPFWELWSVYLGKSDWTDVALGKVEEVEDFLEREVKKLTAAIEADGTDYESYRQRARLYDRLNRFDEAVADYEKAAEGLPDKAVLYYRSARVRDREGRLRDAADTYGRAIDTDPTMPGSYIRRARLYTRVGEHAAALADYEKLIELTSEYGKYRHLAAKLCIDGNEEVFEPGRAVLLMEEAVGIEPQNLEYKLTLGQAFWLLDDHRAAIDVLESGLRPEIPGSNETVRGTLSWWYVMAAEKDRDPDRAILHAKAELDFGAKKMKHVYENHLGMAHYRKGNFPVAEVVLTRALRADISGGDAYHFFCLAMCNQRLGRTEKAQDYFKRALEWRERKKLRGEFRRRDLNALEAEAREVMAE